MATTSDYLNQLVTDKSNIIQAINNKGVTVSSDAKFTDLPSKIGEISGGSSEDKPTGHADVQGLKTIGWTDEDIANFQEYGVFWDEDEDDVYKLTDEELLGQNNPTDRYVPKNSTRSLSSQYCIIGIPSGLKNPFFWSDHKLRYIPNFTSSQASGYAVFQACTNLKKIEDFDSSQYRITNYMFFGCTSLETIPTINTSNSTDTSGMFYNCCSLKKVPLLDTSKSTDTNSMFYNCFNLSKVPLFNTSNSISMSYMFYHCEVLEKIPLFNTSKVEDLCNFLSFAKSITTIPLLDTSVVTDMSYMFNECNSLEEIPLLDTSEVTDMSSMFKNCYLLKEVPQLDTSKVTKMESLFNGCYSLQTIPEINGESCIKLTYIFNQNKSLVNLGGIKDIGKAYSTTVSANYSYYSLTIGSDVLTHDSLMNVINDLYDIATKGCRTQKLILSSTSKALLTSDEIAIATAKGWTVV